MDLGTDLVLVTGAAGWLGQRLLEILTQGLSDVSHLSKPPPHLRIRCLILSRADESRVRRFSDNIEVLAGDLRSAADCVRLCENAAGALLFHTAGVIHPKKVREFHSVNVSATRHLLDAAVQAGLRRAIVVSSNSPLGSNPSRDHVFDEDSPYHPHLNYGRSKMQMEIAVQAIGATGAIETVIVRAPWFYGPYQPPRQTRFFRMIREGKIPLVGDGNNRRSMAYLDNLGQGLILAAITPRAAGRTYWVADERPYTMNEIIDTVEQLLEQEFHIRCAHRRLRLPDLISGAAGVLDRAVQALGLYQAELHVLSEMNKNIACSVARAQRELGYQPKVALEEGMRRSIAWTIENHLL